MFPYKRQLLRQDGPRLAAGTEGFSSFPTLGYTHLLYHWHGGVFRRVKHRDCEGDHLPLSIAEVLNELSLISMSTIGFTCTQPVWIICCSCHQIMLCLKHLQFDPRIVRSLFLRNVVNKYLALKPRRLKTVLFVLDQPYHRSECKWRNRNLSLKVRWSTIGVSAGDVDCSHCAWQF